MSEISSNEFVCQICNKKVLKKELFTHVVKEHSLSDMLSFIKGVGVDVREKK